MSMTIFTNALGARVIGAVVAEAIRPIGAPGPFTVIRNGEPGNLVANAMMLGTAGSALGTATGAIADNYFGEVTGGAFLESGRDRTGYRVAGDHRFEQLERQWSLCPSAQYNATARCPGCRGRGRGDPRAGRARRLDRYQCAISPGLGNRTGHLCQFPGDRVVTPNGPHSMVLRTLPFEIPQLCRK
jgi:hypothetical protein